MRQVRFVRPIISAFVIVALTALAVACGSSTSARNSDRTSAGPPASSAPQQAAPAAPVSKTLIIYGDTVRGPDGLTDDEKTILSCVQQNRFPQGSAIVWRFRVVDPGTAKALDDKELQRVTLTLPDGTTQDLKYGPHPKGKTDDFFWTTSFKVPADYPTGAFTYKLEAVDKEGRTGAYAQFNVASALLQIVPQGQR